MPSILIGVAGPSGGGKSTFCRRLEQSHTNIGRLKLDDFFCDAEEVGHCNGYCTWDHPSSIDWDGLITAAKILKSGASATVPHYDRALDRCVGEKCLLPKEIITVDGFLALHHPALREMMDMSFFFHLPETEQLARRKARQPFVQEGYLHEVMLPNARAYVMPSAAFATHVIDALLPPEMIYERILMSLQTLPVRPVARNNTETNTTEILAELQSTPTL